MDKTLREMCNETNVTRRAVQGYEKLGLVFASGKNERGYLLYDKRAYERVMKINFFQELGFSLKEIVKIIDATNEILKVALQERIEYLKVEKGNLDDLIRRANELLKDLE